MLIDILVIVGAVTLVVGVVASRITKKINGCGNGCADCPFCGECKGQGVKKVDRQG